MRDRMSSISSGRSLSAENFFQGGFNEAQEKADKIQDIAYQKNMENSFEIRNEDQIQPKQKESSLKYYKTYKKLEKVQQINMQFKTTESAFTSMLVRT